MLLLQGERSYVSSVAVTCLIPSSLSTASISQVSLMSSVILHAAVFAAGAVVGGGVAAAVTRRSQHASQALTLPPANASGTLPPPVVDVEKIGGVPQFSGNLASVATLSSPLLKYGNPGTHCSFPPL